MDIRKFDKDAGLYHFHVDGLKTSFHAHPATEFITALTGTFSLRTKFKEYPNLTSAVVAANIWHRVDAATARLSILMVEHHGTLLSKLHKDIPSADGLFVNGVVLEKQPEFIEQFAMGDRYAAYDSRIAIALGYLDNHPIDYREVVPVLCKLTKLSPGRLSHLFKAEAGISIKRYLLWCKLRESISSYLTQQEGMLAHSLDAGFYDQPHFIKSFRSMLGVSPGRSYDSRILQ